MIENKNKGINFNKLNFILFYYY